MDLETIQSRLRKGSYSSATQAFFRDLLLLFTNAIVFFPKDSTESITAHQLRSLTFNEIKTHLPTRPDPLPRKSDPSPSNPPQPKPDSLLSQHKSSSAPILVCRKRSSISKINTTGGFGQNGDRLSNEKKPAPVTKPPVKPSSSDTDDEPPRKVAKEKPPVTGARSLRRSNKNLTSNSNLNKKIQPSSNQKPSSSDKNKTEASASAPDKKRSGAADFLKRIKRNAPAVSDSLRSGGGGSGDGGGSSKGGSSGGKEQKKVNSSSGKGDQKGKERPSRNSGGSNDQKKNETENSSQSKRSVGRPPKKSAEASTVSGKRGRDSGVGGKDKRPKKRSRK